MKKYAFALLPVGILLMAAAIPAGGEKELIIRLEGEVRVLQRQVRDLQESFDKSQGQNILLVQKIADNSDNTVRALASLDESFRNAQTAQNNNLAGATSRLGEIAKQVTAADQRNTQIYSEVKGLKQSVDNTRKALEEKEKEPAALVMGNGPEQLFASAVTAFYKGSFDQAMTGFQRYLDAYGSTDNSDDALYWIGECHQQQNRLDDAIKNYDRVLSEYPESNRTAAVMLRKGQTLLRLERRDEGVQALKGLVARFPRSQEASLAMEDLNRLGETIAPPANTVPASKPTGPARPGSKTGRP
ncbi:MAG: tetratricopeptide repeat protein [Blastocatellia bacterium]